MTPAETRELCGLVNGVLTAQRRLLVFSRLKADSTWAAWVMGEMKTYSDWAKELEEMIDDAD